MDKPEYYGIVKHYEECLAKYGPSYKGMDWPDENDLKKRFDVMLDVIRNDLPHPVSLLDLGCGVGLLIDHLRTKNLLDVYQYWGIDISQKMVASAKKRYPQLRFEVRDILKNPLSPRSVDYVIMNGVLTEKITLSHALMEDYACRLIKAAYDTCRHGIAFNVMSTHVEWEREDLFHWPLDRAVAFLISECSRHIVIRMDYGLYEYTTYVYRDIEK
jgi:SAM-dependent methyltransferase